MFWAEILKISDFFFLKIFIFWWWNFLYIWIGMFSCNANEPQREKTYHLTWAHNGDSDQPSHPRSLIRFFAVYMKNLCILGYICAVWSESSPGVPVRRIILLTLCSILKKFGHQIPYHSFSKTLGKFVLLHVHVFRSYFLWRLIWTTLFAEVFLSKYLGLIQYVVRCLKLQLFQRNFYAWHFSQYDIWRPVYII